MDITQLIRPNILSLKPYHSAREMVQKGVLLDANENPYEQHWEGIQLNRYPDPHQRVLRQSIARFLGVKTENVVAGTLYATQIEVQHRQSRLLVDLSRDLVHRGEGQGDGQGQDQRQDKNSPRRPHRLSLYPRGTSRS